MKIDILTIFPKMFDSPFAESLIKRAIDNKIIQINTIDIRSFSKDKHKKVDDKPFGGGVGMVLKPEPIFDALKNSGVKKKNKEYKNRYNKPLIIYMSPQGKVLNNKIVNNLSNFKKLIILCGHYEGIDERIMNFVDEEISIGDFVLTGGELPAMVLIDAVARMLPGVVKEFNSVKNDSFYNGILDYPQYTRPAIFKGLSVPKQLLSGNHREIENWRLKQAYLATKKKRPDLLKNKVKI
ncbi:MAG: tRNA (guanosine(37)-N1)-methyltransferase TrmD [Elusimicrobiota bacterium]|jgi:tRNA (guanine37-N1)-methyltransferase|nr:tRNA (guanosine(37)-N1)-methyltransferase TrmD [Elusimicrobiota bacterium]